MITHTYRAGRVAETRDMCCDRCGKRVSSVTFLVAEPGGQINRSRRRRGLGAAALARKVENGHMILKQEGQ